MNVFIVGGTGFVGRRIIKSLVERGHAVVCMDIAPPAGLFDSYGDKVRLVRGDITQFEEVMAAMLGAKAERAVNLSYYLGSDVAPRLAQKLNIFGMDNFFEAARLCGVAHTVFASSFIVMGDQRHFGERPISEQDHPHPDDQYSMHKMFNEFQARDYAEKYDMRITAIRPANITGFDKLHGSMDHVRCITYPAHGQSVEFEWKDAIWCPIHIDDATEAFVRVVLADKPQHQIYNTGGNAITLGELSTVVRGFLPDARITFRNESGGKRSNPINYLIDNQRIVSEFGLQYEPFPKRVLQIINEVRAQDGQPAISG